MENQTSAGFLTLVTHLSNLVAGQCWPANLAEQFEHICLLQKSCKVILFCGFILV